LAFSRQRQAENFLEITKGNPEAPHLVLLECSCVNAETTQEGGVIVFGASQNAISIGALNSVATYDTTLDYWYNLAFLN